MNHWNKALVLLTAAAFTGACAGNKGGPPPQDKHNCPGSNPGIVPITINYQQSPINVIGPNQDVHEGDVLRFNLVGANNILVSTSGKTAVDGWLNGSGFKSNGKSNSDRFYVCVPTFLFEGEPESVTEKDYSYNVDAVGKPQLDPVVPVRRAK